MTSRAADLARSPMCSSRHSRPRSSWREVLAANGKRVTGEGTGLDIYRKIRSQSFKKNSVFPAGYFFTEIFYELFQEFFRSFYEIVVLWDPDDVTRHMLLRRARDILKTGLFYQNTPFKPHFLSIPIRGVPRSLESVFFIRSGL